MREGKQPGWEGGVYQQMREKLISARPQALGTAEDHHRAATPGDRDLPPPTDEFGQFVSTAEVDWSERESVIEYLVAYSRLLAGGHQPRDPRAHRLSGSGERAMTDSEKTTATVEGLVEVARRTTTQHAAPAAASGAGSPPGGSAARTS
jgi:hypothetical protein